MPCSLHQIEDHAGIERAAARAHHQAVDRGEAHRARDAAAVLDGAQAGAVAEMRDDDAPGRERRRKFAQRDYEIFIRQAVEAVAPDAGVGNRRGRAKPGQDATGCGGTPCRSRRPAACAAPRSRSCGWRRDCAADAAAPAAPASQGRPAHPCHPHRRVIAHAAMHDAVPDAGNRFSAASLRPSARISRVAASWSNPSAGQVRSSTISPLASADLQRGATPIPSIWPRNRQIVVASTAS